ncbi:unnamed protein product [Owenia fusiformis]|uniref:S-methyl-5'-thioadenosine phosphorylase n=1 Tax=Owenia fusiformis TaxID=6347 RepID=A0A8S4N046_OWEFU|nr:unnamed protein product [Owenia fusiformis]
MTTIKIGIIGGSGLDNPDILEGRTEKFVETPFGKPSDALLIGKIKDVDCVLLARHGRSHKINPTSVNYRANICALKMEGCTHCIVTTACGSLQEGIHPGDIVFLDQFIDRTQKRTQTFFDCSETGMKGVCHIPMHTPFCDDSVQILINSAKAIGLNHHPTGTMLTIEGPRFSSKAESVLWHQWGAHCVNMSTVPEVVLAKEAGLSYAAIALVTDYDSWHESKEPVNVENVLKTFKQNAKQACDLILHAIPKFAQKDWTDIVKANKDLVEGSIMPGTK